MLLHQWFCKEPDCRKIREEIVEVERQLRQVLDRQGQGQLLKPADLENELQDEISLEIFLSGFKLALGIAAELAPSCSSSTMKKNSWPARLFGKGRVSDGKEANQR